MCLCRLKPFFQESNFLTYKVSRQDRELLEMADVRNLRVCLCMPKGHDWENAAIAGTGDMKIEKPFGQSKVGIIKILAVF